MFVFRHLICFEFHYQILYDFAITFKTIDVESLRRKWPQIVDKIDQVQSSLIDFSTVPVRNKEMLKFLQFFKVFKTNRQQFDKALKSYIVFSDVNIFQTFSINVYLKCTIFASFRAHTMIQ